LKHAWRRTTEPKDESILATNDNNQYHMDSNVFPSSFREANARLSNKDLENEKNYRSSSLALHTSNASHDKAHFYTEDTGSLYTPLDEPCTERQDYSEFSLEKDNQKSTVAAVEVKN